MLRGASERHIFNESFCDASEAIHFQRASVWRDKKWRVLQKILCGASGANVFFNERLSGAFQTNRFPRECLWRFRASHWRTLFSSVLPPFGNTVGRGESCTSSVTAPDINEEEGQP